LVANAEIALGRKTVKSKLLPRGSTSPVEVELSARDPQAANRALKLLGKHLGLFRLYQRVVDDLDTLVRAVGLKAA
jgi:hypothetical protein